MPGRGRPFQKGESGRPEQDQRVMRAIKKLKDEDGEPDDDDDSDRPRSYLAREEV